MYKKRLKSHYIVILIFHFYGWDGFEEVKNKEFEKKI